MLLVFCVHAAGNAAFVGWGLDLASATFASLPSPTQQILFWLYRSHHGVFLFFVLSGYLIGRMWRRAASPPGGPGALGPPGDVRGLPNACTEYARYALRRALRIYPAFLLAFAGSLAFAYASGTWTPPDWPRILGNLVFLNGAPGGGVAPFNVVTWSLFYEMSFYLGFPLLVLALRHRTAIAVAGIVAPVLAHAAGADALVLCWSLLFIGVALAYSSARWPRLPAPAVIAAYLAITTCAALDLLPATAAILAFGAVAATIVSLCVRGDNAVARALAWGPLRALGRVSYSFYLVHWMIVVLVARAMAGASPLAATAVVFLGGFALSCAAAIASWQIAERPYFERSSRSRT